MITLQCKLTPEDYIKALYLNMRPSPWLKYVGIAALAFCLVMLVSAAFSSNRYIGGFRTFVPMLGIGLFYVFILFYSIPRNARRIFSQQKTLQVEYKTVISPEVIETTSENGSMRMNLSDFHKYKVSKDLVLLYQSQAIFHMFPRRFFATEEDFELFISYLEDHLGSPA
jgi:YcxB-like protein